MDNKELIKSIEWLKRLVRVNKRANLDGTCAEILLNLIEKQSKEIEELKGNNKNLEDELNKYIVKMSDEQYRRLVDIIRDETNKSWVYKIKAKIEELENEHTGCTTNVFSVLQSLLEKE